MEYYQAQYYNEALQHYGVKGMKWGVRRKRAAAYGKALGKAMATNAKHPRITSKQIKALKKGKKFKTKARMSTLGLNTKELNSLNKGVAKGVKQKQRAKAAKKLSRKERRKTMRALRANTILHPVKAQNAMIETQKNASLKTTARQHYLGYNTQEAKAITKHIRKQVAEEANAAAKAARKPRKRKRKRR